MNHAERLALIHRPFLITYMGGRGNYPWGGVQTGLSGVVAFVDASGGRRASESMLRYAGSVNNPYGINDTEFTPVYEEMDIDAAREDGLL